MLLLKGNRLGMLSEVFLLSFSLYYGITYYTKSYCILTLRGHFLLRIHKLLIAGKRCPSDDRSAKRTGTTEDTQSTVKDFGASRAG